MSRDKIFETRIARMDHDIATGKYYEQAQKKSGFRSTQMCALLDQLIQSEAFTVENTFGKPVGVPQVVKLVPQEILLDEESKVIAHISETKEELPDIGIPIELEKK